MTFDEALAKLGLSRGASPDRARRAYLQLLKKTRPESDRDEFIALRNAYEIVRALLPLMAQLEPASSAPVDRAANHSNAAEVTPVVEGGEPAVSDSAQPAAGSAPAAPYRSARPDRALPPTEAARTMCELFDRLGHDPSAVLPVVEGLRLTLTCLARGEVTPALALSERVSAWLQRSGRETSLDPALLTMWITVRELADLAPVVPPRVLAPIAVATLDGELARASSALTAFHIERPEAALAALAQMKQKAPWLAATVGWSLAKPPRKRWTFNLGWVSAPASLIVYIVLRIFTSLVTTTARDNREWTPPVKQAWVSPQSVEIAMKADAGPAERLKRALALFFQLTESVADTMRSCQMAPAEALVKQLTENVRNGNCAYAEAPMSQLRELKTAYPPEEWACASEHVQALDRSFILVCTEAQKIFPPRNTQ